MMHGQKNIILSNYVFDSLWTLSLHDVCWVTCRK